MISGLCAGRRSRARIKIAAAHRLRRARAAASNPQGNSKYYHGRVSRRADCWSSTELKLHARSRLQALQGGGAVLFSIAAGPPAVFSKKVRNSSSSKMRTGESCLVVVGLSFECVRTRRPRTHACASQRRTSDNRQREANPNSLPKSPNECIALTKSGQ